MTDILIHYQLFIFVFFLLLFFTYLVYSTFFRPQYFENYEMELGEYQEDKYFSIKKLLKSTNPDRVLEYQLQKLFLNPKKGIIIFLKSYNLLRIYHESELDNLYEFYENWNSKSFKFKDEKMETLRELLHTDIQEFLFLLDASSEETTNGYMKVENNLDRLYYLIDSILRNYNIVDEQIESTRSIV